MEISYIRPKLEPTVPSVYRVIRDEEQFEIVVDEELDDRCKESLRFQFTLQQSELLDELLDSNLESAPEPLLASRALMSKSYNLPVPDPITSNTLFLREEIVRVLGISAINSLVNDELREHIESLRTRQMEIGIWLYRLPKSWIENVLN